jgi:hypothetical protein
MIALLLRQICLSLAVSNDGSKSTSSSLHPNDATSYAALDLPWFHTRPVVNQLRTGLQLTSPLVSRRGLVPARLQKPNIEAARQDLVAKRSGQETHHAEGSAMRRSPGSQAPELTTVPTLIEEIQLVSEDRLFETHHGERKQLIERGFFEQAQA